MCQQRAVLTVLEGVPECLLVFCICLHPVEVGGVVQQCHVSCEHCRQHTQQQHRRGAGESSTHRCPRRHTTKFIQCTSNDCYCCPEAQHLLKAETQAACQFTNLTDDLLIMSGRGSAFSAADADGLCCGLHWWWPPGPTCTSQSHCRRFLKYWLVHLVGVVTQAPSNPL